MEKLDLNKYLEVPYKHRGRDLSGWDCYGMILYAYKERSFELFDIENYDRNWSFKGRNLLLENYHLQWAKTNKPVYLDAIIFKETDGRINHGGLYLDERWFIHCCRQGTIRCRLDSEPWSKKIEGFYHLKARDANC